MSSIQSSDVRPVLRVGSLAYWDSMSGTIPCKVLRIQGESGAAGSAQVATLKLTASRGPWKRGEILSEWGLHVVPRKALFPRRHGARIGYYTVEAQS